MSGRRARTAWYWRSTGNGGHCPSVSTPSTPGYTATDLNGHQGTQTVAEGAEIIVRMATIGPDGPTGGFFDNTGPAAW